MSLVDILNPSAPPAHESLPRRTHRMEDDAKKKRLAAIASAAEKQPSAASQETSLPKRITELLQRQQPLTRGELLERLECDATHLEFALNGLTRHDKAYGIRGEGYRLGPRPIDAGNEEPTSQETTVPKGQYDRSKAKPRSKKTGDSDAAIAAPATDVGEKTKHKRRAGAKNVGNAARARKTNGAASFAINDAGCVTVVGADGARVELSGPDTKRLEAFIGRTKQIRG